MKKISLFALLIFTGLIAKCWAQSVSVPLGTVQIGGQNYNVTESFTLTPATPPPPPPPPTCSAISAPGTSTLKDASGNTWSWGGPYPQSSFPGNHNWQLLENGQPSNGGGIVFTVFNNGVYVQQSPNDPINPSQWWQWTGGTSWAETPAPPCTLTTLSANVGDPQVLPHSAFVPAGYHLTFNSEFPNLNGIDQSGTQGGINNTAGIWWYNGIEQCCMTPPNPPDYGTMYPTLVQGAPLSPFSLDPLGGLDLSLTAIPSCPTQPCNQWNSAVPQTLGRDNKGFAQQYGYFEMSAQFPGTKGTWPAFWMLAQSHAANGEIDIVEDYGMLDTPPNTHYCVGNHVNSTGQCAANPSGVDESTGYHVYALLWTATTMTWLFDGKQVFTEPNVVNEPYYLLFDLGIGGGWPAGSGVTASPSVMKIKYIRVYQGQ